MGLLEAALWGAFGGAISEAPQLLRYRYRSQRPKWMKDWYFWGIVLLKAAVGGLFSLAFSATQIPMNPIFAIHVGVAWPLILAEMGRAAPDVRPGD